MKKITFGTPEKFTPAKYCKGLYYNETEVKYPINDIEFKVNNRGCVLKLPLTQAEQIYGLGLLLMGFNHKWRKLTLRVNADPVTKAGDSHAPVPFFVSTEGYGIYIDTARYAEFYFGSSKLLEDKSGKEESKSKKIAMSVEELYSADDNTGSNISIQVPVAKGVDIYIFEGENITDIVSQYNMFSGGGCDAPEWSLEPIYRCNAQSTWRDVLNTADYFIKNDIPIKTLGLEPGWQSASYSCSYTWDSERFSEYEKMINELKNLGFHINLWEHAFVHPTAPFYDEIKKYSGDYEVWKGCVPDFSIEKAQEIFAEHHKKLTKLGIDGFKLDECDSSDYGSCWSFPNLSEFPSGLDGEQYHSLFGVLYMQAVSKALGNKPFLSEVRSAGALAASYPFVLYSDLYDHRQFVRGCCTSRFSGLLWTPEVRDAENKEEFLRRLQSNVFSVQCIINAWYCEKMPWLDFDCENEIRELLYERKKLKPILKKAFENYKSKGIPPVRALVSDYTFDRETYNIDDEYLLGENLLVAPIIYGEKGRRVYIPEGNWQNYFTKEKAENGWNEVITDFIPVYEKV